MANRNVKLKNKSGDYLYPYTDNIPTATTSKAGIVKLDSAPTANSNNAITSGAVNTAINTVNTNLSNKLGKTETAAKATADADGNNIANTYLKKTETAAKATADADGNNIASTYLKKGDEGKGGLNLLVNQLRKAYAWTWSQTSSSGMVYVIYNSNGDMLDGVACSSYASYGGYGGYRQQVVSERKLYRQKISWAVKMNHFANKYIGLPWVAGAQGPDNFDCWGFARYVLKAEYGHDVPQVTTNPDNLRDVLHAFKHDLAFQAFYEVPEPQDGDVVLMRQAKNPVHAGIWLDVDGGGVLHCVRGNGVVFQDVPSLNLCGWFLHSYYRVKYSSDSV